MERSELTLIPRRGNIRIKEQEGRYIVFNLDTSGFHLLTPDGLAVLNEVDGQANIEELCGRFSSRLNKEVEELKPLFIQFFKELEIRRIVQV